MPLVMTNHFSNVCKSLKRKVVLFLGKNSWSWLESLADNVIRVKSRHSRASTTSFRPQTSWQMAWLAPINSRQILATPSPILVRYVFTKRNIVDQALIIPVMLSGTVWAKLGVHTHVRCLVTFPLSNHLTLFRPPMLLHRRPISIALSVCSIVYCG